MKGRDIYKIWSPTGVLWTEWVRPVCFVALDFNMNRDMVNLDIPQINYIKELQADTAIILDLPENNSIKESLSLANLGWRPIPLYNGTNGKDGAVALIDNSAIEIALLQGAKELQKITFKSDAPPVFLLDSNRIFRFKMDVSIFDNSWDIYGQDMPSAEYFLNNGIKKIIVRSDEILRDLNIILHKYQKAGIAIYLSSRYEQPQKIVIKKPRRKHIKMS